MHLQTWAAVGIVAGAILAVLGVVAVAIRAARALFRTLKKLDVLADDLLGDTARNMPSIVERVRTLDGKLNDHINWHNPPASNSVTPARRR